MPFKTVINLPTPAGMWYMTDIHQLAMSYIVYRLVELLIRWYTTYLLFLQNHLILHSW